MLEKLKATPIPAEFVQGLLARTRAALLSRYNGISRIYIFGSAARGEMTDYSDIDILVTVSDESRVRLARKAFAALTLELNHPLDLLVYTDEDFDKKSQIGGVCYDALHEGLLLYG